MKLQQLRYLNGVIQAGSITEAARRMNVSQPALSASLAALEAELGGPLLERQRGRARLTPLGIRFHQRAAAILHQCQLAKAEFTRGLKSRTIRFGVLPTVPMSWVVDLASHIQGLLPEAELEFRELPAAKIAVRLSQKRVDAAISVADGSSGGRWLPLLEEPFVAVCGTSHRFANLSAIQLGDLDSEPFIYRKHCEAQDEISELIRSKGVKINAVYVTDQDERAIRAVIEGVGVTIAPTSLVSRSAVGVPIRDLPIKRSVGIRLSPAIEQDLSRIIEKAVGRVLSMRS